MTALASLIELTEAQPATQVEMLDLTLRYLRGSTVGRCRELRTVPVNLRDARLFIDHVHRHCDAPQGWKYGIGLRDSVGLVGVIAAGRPVARLLDDGETIELTRVCLMGGVANGVSRLIGAAVRIARDMGYGNVITYTLECEDGHSLKALGFVDEGVVAGGQWGRAGREREERGEELAGAKRRWRLSLRKGVA